MPSCVRSTKPMRKRVLIAHIIKSFVISCLCWGCAVHDTFAAPPQEGPTPTSLVHERVCFNKASE